MVLCRADVCHEGALLRGQSFEFSSDLLSSSSIDGTYDGKKSAGRRTGRDQKVFEVHIEEGDIVAPGLIELQTNGLCGIHFTSLTEDDYEASLEKVSIEMAKNGVTGWYATIPTVEGARWKQVSMSSVGFPLNINHSHLHSRLYGFRVVRSNKRNTERRSSSQIIPQTSL